MCTLCVVGPYATCTSLMFAGAIRDFDASDLTTIGSAMRDLYTVGFAQPIRYQPTIDLNLAAS